MQYYLQQYIYDTTTINNTQLQLLLQHQYHFHHQQFQEQTKEI